MSYEEEQLLSFNMATGCKTINSCIARVVACTFNEIVIHIKTPKTKHVVYTIENVKWE